MGRKTLFPLLCALATVAALLSGCSDKPPEYKVNQSFSARYIIKSGDKTAEYKFNFSGQKVRLEMVKPGTGVTIIRKDLGVIWTVMTDNKLFLEMPVQPNNKNPLVFVPDRTIRYKRLGEETLDGRKVVKEQVTIQNKGENKKREFLRWFDPSLGWPVKIAALDGKWSMLFTDIVPGPQDPALFEIPKDYRAIAGRKRPAHKKGTGSK